MGPIIGIRWGTHGAGADASLQPGGGTRRITGMNTSVNGRATGSDGPVDDAAEASVIRLQRGDRGRRGGHYCSGFVTTPEMLAGAGREDAPLGQAQSNAEFALTAAHFLRNVDDPSAIRISGRGWRGRVADARVIVGTDIAVLRLARPAPAGPLLPVATAVTPVPADTVTYGFGGGVTGSAPPRYGRLVAKLPFAVSPNLRTRVRYAGVCFPTERDQVRYGDSGGPVLVDGAVVGLQSLLVGYRHRELVNIATVALLPPHLTAIRRATGIMSAR